MHRQECNKQLRLRKCNRRLRCNHMKIALSEEELLRARGWTEIVSATRPHWAHPDPAKDDRQGAGNLTSDAVQQQRREDECAAWLVGSVSYRATAEQAQSPLLAACAAAGMLERDVIAKLHEEVRRLQGALARVLKTQAPHMVVFMESERAS